MVQVCMNVFEVFTKKIVSGRCVNGQISMGKRFGIGFHFSDRIFKELKSLTQLAVWFIQIKNIQRFYFRIV